MAAEQDLLRRASQFDREAPGEVYDIYSPALYRYAVRLLRSTDLAEECVADVFSRFLDALSKGKGPRERLKAYLYRMAHNWITDQWRRRPPALSALQEEPITDGSGDPQEHVRRQADREQVRKALAGLTPEQHEVVVLKFLEGLQNEEIASALGKPVGAVKSLQHRALDALRRALDRADEDVHEPVS